MKKASIKVLPGKADFALVTRAADHEIEHLVISALVLTGKAAIRRYFGVIKESWFTDSVFRRIYRIVAEMYGEGLDIEISILQQRLRQLPNWDEIPEGDERLNLVCEKGIQLENIDNYVHILGEQYRMRRFQDVVMEAWKSINTPAGRITGSDSTAKIAGSLITSIRSIANEGVIRNGFSLGEVAREREIERERIAALQQRYTGVVSGITKLDEMTLGFQKGDGIIVAARPSMGKTSIGLDFIRNAEANNPKGHYHIDSFEMSKEALCDRFTSKATKINLARLRAPAHLTPNERNKIRQAEEEFQSKNISISDQFSSIDEMIMNWYRKADSTGLDLVLLDYLQLAAGTELHKHGNDMRIAVMQTYRKVKQAAKDINVPVVLLCQLSRKVDDRADHRPIMSDLAESASLEADADLIMFLYREAKYDKTIVDSKMEIILEKQRNGPTGSVFAGFEPTTASISNLETKFTQQQKALNEEILKGLKMQ